MAERDLRRLLEHVCAYCGILKSDRPPVWCVRRHEVWEGKQMALAAKAEEPGPAQTEKVCHIVGCERPVPHEHVISGPAQPESQEEER